MLALVLCCTGRDDQDNEEVTGLFLLQNGDSDTLLRKINVTG
jgi:hypothetical protein